MNHAHRLFLLITILVTYGCGSSQIIDPGSSAPDFDLRAVRGGSYHLADLSGQVILLSFINTQAEATSATTDPSRAQIVFLKSMQEQYGSQGLIVMIIDAARIATGSNPGTDQLINFTYDWQLDNVPVLDDTDSTVARSYAVISTPTTFLVGANRIIQQRWDGFASASQLALSIEALVGAPGHRQVDTAESTADSPVAICPNETRPQAKFAGVGLARPFSEELWVVDGGQSWETGVNFPVQWVLLDAQNLTQQGEIHLRALGEYMDTQEIVELSDGSMELLTADVASGLLSGIDTPSTTYSLVTTVSLERPGCLKVWVVVTREGTTVPLYEGSLIISAR